MYLNMGVTVMGGRGGGAKKRRDHADNRDMKLQAHRNRWATRTHIVLLLQGQLLSPGQELALIVSTH